MATMNVSLPTDMVKFVEAEVAEGGYGSASEVVRDALRLLWREKASEQEKLAILRREIDRGFEQAANRQFSKRSVMDIADSVARDHFGSRAPRDQ